MKLLLLLTIIILLIAACEPMPIEPVEPTPDKPVDQQATPILNYNPGLILGHCNVVRFNDGIWKRAEVDQCWPDKYTLYQVWQMRGGDTDNDKDFVTTNPMAVLYNGASYTIYPFGRAGDVGFTSLPIALNPGCYKAEIRGDNHLVYLKEYKAGFSIRVGSDQRESKSIIGNSVYSYAWFFNAETEMSVPITFYANFPYGNTVTGESWLTITDFKVVPVSIGHCG